MKRITYFQARYSILVSFDSFADIEFQMNKWIKSSAAHCFSDSIAWYGFDELADSFTLHREAHAQIGWTLYDEEEAEAVQEYFAWFVELYVDDIGESKPDKYYYQDSRWVQVIQGAFKVRKLMAQKNYENKFWKYYYEDMGDIYDENSKGPSQLTDAAYPTKEIPTIEEIQAIINNSPNNINNKPKV